MNFERFEDLPEHQRAAMSAGQRTYYKAVLNGPKTGHGYVTAHRQAEMLTGTHETRRRFSDYFPQESLVTLDSFIETHWRQEPTTGGNVESTLANRIKRHYPDLFPRLRDRLSAMFELPQFAAERIRFELLEEAFYSDLACAEQLARRLDGSERRKRLHSDYRLAFANIHDGLHGLVSDLAIDASP